MDDTTKGRELNALEAERRLRKAAVCKLTGWSRATLERRIRAGRFPAPERDGSIAYWRARTVLDALRGGAGNEPGEPA